MHLYSVLNWSVEVYHAVHILVFLSHVNWLEVYLSQSLNSYSLNKSSLKFSDQLWIKRPKKSQLWPEKRAHLVGDHFQLGILSRFNFAPLVSWPTVSAGAPFRKKKSTLKISRPFPRELHQVSIWGRFSYNPGTPFPSSGNCHPSSLEFLHTSIPLSVAAT